MTVSDEYDVIVIGAGPGGEVVVGRCAEGGLSTVLVERELVGGECSYWACMPSKGLLRPGSVVELTRRVPGARETITRAIDASPALERRNEITDGWDDERQLKWLRDRSIDLFRGIGRIVGPRTIEVEQEEGPHVRLNARRAVILSAGWIPRIPPIDG